MNDMAHYTPDAALAVADILRDMRAKERELWSGEPPRMGCFAVALMLDAYIDRLAVAIGDLPPPKGRAPGGGELEASPSTSGEDEDEDDGTVDIAGIMDDPDYLPGDVAIALGL